MSPRQFAAEYARAPVIYCAFGGMEYHGRHTWLGTDYFKGREICLRAAEQAGGVVHPTIPIVPGGAQLSYDELKAKLDYHRYPGVFGGGPLCRALAEEVLRFFAECLKFRVCVAFGSHGPAADLLQAIAREQSGRLGGMRLIAVRTGELCKDLLLAAQARHGLKASGAHGGLWETSIDMAESGSAVDLTELDRPVGDFHAMPPNVDQENRRSTAAFGEELLRTCAERLAGMVRDALKDARRGPETDPAPVLVTSGVASMAPADAASALEDEAAVRHWAAAAGFPDTDGARIAQQAAAIAAAPAARERVLHFMERAYGRGESLTPADAAGAGEDPMAVLSVVAAALVPLVRSTHARIGLPAEVTEESLRRIGRTVEWFRDTPQKLAAGLYWLGKYYREPMFAAGRFEYVARPFSTGGTVSAFAHRASGRVIAIAEPGLPIGHDGLPVPDGAVPAFVTARSDTAGVLRGHPVTPSGRVLAEVAEWPRSEWACVLKPGMYILDLHIPGSGGRLDLDACGASLRRASTIGRRYLWRYGIRVVACQSWTLNPDWETLLPDSNLAAFMRETYMYPLRAQEHSGISFVFGCPAEQLDVRQAPRRTALQRIMLERFEKGQLLRAGGMFMLLEHAGWFFGRTYYRAVC